MATRGRFPEEGQALDRPAADLEELARSIDPERPRIPICASPSQRTLLHVWEPGPDRPAHVHRRASEAFLVLAGTVVFILGETEQVDCPEGTLLVVHRGLSHGFVVNGRAAVLVIVSPNAYGDHEAPTGADRLSAPSDRDWSRTSGLFERPSNIAARSRSVLAETQDLRVAVHVVPAGDELVSHRHESDELFLPLYGGMVLEQEQHGPIWLQKGSVAFAPTLSMHGVRASETGPLALLTIAARAASSAEAARPGHA